MSKEKTVNHIFEPAPPHMVGDGFRVHNFFPSGHKIGQHRMSPFFLMDYNSKIEFPPSDKPRGVDVHPHRGFETVTIAYNGRIEHYDSTGKSGVIGEGDIQWMTAGSGILHKEFHEKEFSKQGGEFQMVQLWVNLPAKDKKAPPKYQDLKNSQLGKYQVQDDKGIMEVIAGEYKGVKGPASTFTPIEMYNGRLKKDAQLDISLPADFNTGILVIEGSIKINNDKTAPADHFILFNNDGTEIKIETLEDSIFLVLSGEPINEPIVAYGPFLMNTVDEVQEAIRDFNSGKYGTLE